MKETNLERIQRDVFSYDTEAGYALRYHITRSLADPVYAKKIDFGFSDQTQNICQLFRFGYTPECVDYWYAVHSGIRDK